MPKSLVSYLDACGLFYCEAVPFDVGQHYQGKCYYCLSLALHGCEAAWEVGYGGDDDDDGCWVHCWHCQVLVCLGSQGYSCPRN